MLRAEIEPVGRLRVKHDPHAFADGQTGEGPHDGDAMVLLARNSLAKSTRRVGFRILAHMEPQPDLPQTPVILGTHGERDLGVGRDRRVRVRRVDRHLGTRSADASISFRGGSTFSIPSASFSRKMYA